jgi:hypothetical protein
VLHEAGDAAARWLSDALAGEAVARRLGVAVHALSTHALRTALRWSVRVDRDGSSCRLRARGFDAAAGGPAVDADGSLPTRIAGVVSRLRPLSALAGVPDGEYKAAEWHALLTAWLHGLPCPVLNRPRVGAVSTELLPVALWRQRAAARGLPVLPWRVGAGGAGGAGGDPAALHQVRPASTVALVVAGRECLWPQHAGAAATPGWTGAMGSRAAALFGADALVGVSGVPAADGVWRIDAVTVAPDLRVFGAAAAAAVAANLAGSGR